MRRAEQDAKSLAVIHLHGPGHGLAIEVPFAIEFIKPNFGILSRWREGGTAFHQVLDCSA